MKYPIMALQRLLVFRDQDGSGGNSVDDKLALEPADKTAASVLAAGDIGDRAGKEENSSKVDYYALLTSVISKLEDNSAESRQALYKRARATLTAQLRKRVPPASALALVRELGVLAVAVSKVENEISKQQSRAPTDFNGDRQSSEVD